MTAASSILPQSLYNFTKKYLEIQITLSVSHNESIINDLQRGTIDLGFVEGKTQNTNMHLEEIAEDEIVIIASDNNPLARKEILTIQEILTQPFIMPETGSDIREFIKKFLTRERLIPVISGYP
jgi:DNA-binding transcriptional LysR family regulator